MSMTEVQEIYKLSIIMPFIVVGGIFLPSSIHHMLSRDTLLSLVSFFALSTGIISLYYYENLGIEVTRLVAYSMPIATIFYGSYIFRMLNTKNIFVYGFLLLYLLGMFFMALIFVYGFGIQAHDSGISDRDARVSSQYIELSNSEQAIVVGDIKIVSKMSSFMGTMNYDFYWDAYPTSNSLMERNIADFVIYRKYSVTDLQNVNYDNQDQEINQYNLEPHTFLSLESHYYYKTLENDDIIIYAKS
tara:strand:+ start:606 stop:1340 length:735 start_codon:yes stop_codon:yes gene_type:complete